jgi:hypothetical protein
MTHFYLTQESQATFTGGGYNGYMIGVGNGTTPLYIDTTGSNTSAILEPGEYSIYAQAYGTSSGADGTVSFEPTPEPALLSLAAVPAMLLTVRSRRRKPCRVGCTQPTA